MLDIKKIRENSNLVKKALKNRGVKFDLDRLLLLDEERRAKMKEVDDLRARQNRLSKEIATLGGEMREEKLQESKEVKKTLADAEAELRASEEEFHALMRQLPNIPEEDVPVGRDASENKVIREAGEKPKFGFLPRDYLEIARALGLIDTERAAKVSGSRFGYLMGVAARLEMTLVQCAFDHLLPHGFIPVIPPVLITEKMMKGMGYIDSEKDKDERYFLEKDSFYLVGTAEQSIGPMHADEIFQESDLPKRYVAFSTCFRREAGSYGKDTKGILRVHQFDKVEMFSFAHPEKSKDEHQFLLRLEEELMQKLGLSYRVVQLCTGDLSHPSASTYDIEAWLPGQNGGKGEYRETHSTSNTTDFQSRRLNVKYRMQPTTYNLQPRYVHMLNGTAFAMGRTIIAILENYQQEDGSVCIPAALQKYMGGVKEIKK